MLVSAYPDNTYNMCAEFSSDNVDDYGSIKSYNQLQEELYNWQEVSSVETNENPNAVWGDAYTAIARGQPGARGHRGTGRCQDSQAPGRQRRGAHLPRIRPLGTGQHVLHALQHQPPGRPRSTLYGTRRNRAEPEIQPGNGSRGLRKDDRGHRNRHPAHRRRDLLGSQVPFQLQGRLLLRIARLPVPRGLGQRHQIRKHGARVGSQIAAPRPRLPGRIPAQPVERHFESVQLHVAEGQLPYLDGTFQCRRDFLQLREPEPLHARQVDRRLRDDRDIRDHDEPPGQQVRLEAPHMGIRVRALPASAGAVPLRILRPRAGHRLHPLAVRGGQRRRSAAQPCRGLYHEKGLSGRPGRHEHVGAEPAHRLLLQRTDRRVDQQMGRCPGLRHDAQGSRKNPRTT